MTTAPPTMTQPSAGPLFLGPVAIATFLNVSKMTVYRLIDNGEIKAFRVGRSIRVHRRDLDDYLTRARMAP